jgi:hypothetical protein
MQFWLVVKIIAALLKIIPKIIEAGNDAIINVQIKRDGEKIDAIFENKSIPANQRASNLNDIFRK